MRDSGKAVLRGDGNWESLVIFHCFPRYSNRMRNVLVMSVFLFLTWRGKPLMFVWVADRYPACWSFHGDLLSSLCPFLSSTSPRYSQLDFGYSWLIECTARRLEWQEGEVKEFLPFSWLSRAPSSPRSPPARQSLTLWSQLVHDSLPVALVAWRFQILNSPYSASPLCLFTKD